MRDRYNAHAPQCETVINLALHDKLNLTDIFSRQVNANGALPFMQSRVKKVETKEKSVELEIVSFIVAY